MLCLFSMSIIALVVILNDPSVPSTLSGNNLCPGATSSSWYSVQTYSFSDLFSWSLCFSVYAVILSLVQVLRPNWIILVALSGSLLVLGIYRIIMFGSVGTKHSNVSTGAVITFGLLATPFFMLLRYMSKKSAVKVTADDMVKYTEAWLNCHISTGDCEAIKTLCKGKQIEISKARNEALSLWRSKDATPLSFKSSDFSLLERFIFWLGAGSLGCMAFQDV